MKEMWYTNSTINLRVGEDTMRGLKDRLVEELKTGKLAWLLEIVRSNHALTLGICENYLTVYYRGALACTIKPGGGYTFLLDESHFASPEMKEEYNIFMRDKKAISVYQRKFPILMLAMDQVAEKGNLNVLFSYQIVDESVCVLDPMFPLGDEVVMLCVVNGQLCALQVFDGDVSKVMKLKSAVVSADVADVVGSARAQMANLLDLGLLPSEFTFSDDVQGVLLCTPSNQAAAVGAKTLVLPEGKFNLLEGALS